MYNPGDIASGVMADALLRAVKWQVHTAACGVLWRCSSSNVFLWERSESMLEMDRIDEQFMQGKLQLNTYFILTSILPLLLTSRQNHLILTLLLPLLINLLQNRDTNSKSVSRGHAPALKEPY